MRLIEIKPYIDILVATLLIDDNSDARKDGYRLTKIMLTKKEWELLANLCFILEGFAEATTYLGASKYVTHSIMSPLLKEIERRIKPANLVFETDVDLENIDDVFEKIDEGEILETNEKKIDFTTNQYQKLNLNDSLDTYGMLEKVKYHLYKAIKIYWHTEEGDALISAILDPKIKSLTFINNQDSKDQAKTLLQNKYNILKGENLSLILPEIRSILS